MGTKWSEISKAFGGARTDNAVRSHQPALSCCVDDRFAQVFRRWDELTKEKGAPKSKKRNRSEKGTTTTSRNKSMAQSGGKPRAGKKKKAASEEEEEAEVEIEAEAEVEEDQLNEEPPEAEPASLIDPQLQGEAIQPIDENAEPPRKRQKTDTLSVRALAQTEDASDGPPSDEDAALDYDVLQKQLLSAPQTTRSGRQTKPRATRATSAAKNAKG
jgi:hypothetical protein